MSLSPMPSTFRRVRRIDGHHTGTYVRTVHGGQGFKRWTAARILSAAAMDATEVRASARGSMSLRKCRRPCTVHGGKRFHWLSATLIGNAVYARTVGASQSIEARSRAETFGNFVVPAHGSQSTHYRQAGEQTSRPADMEYVAERYNGDVRKSLRPATSTAINYCTTTTTTTATYY